MLTAAALRSDRRPALYEATVAVCRAAGNGSASGGACDEVVVSIGVRKARPAADGGAIQHIPSVILYTLKVESTQGRARVTSASAPRRGGARARASS